MNPRSQNILIAVLAGLLILAVGGLYRQQLTLRAQRNSIDSIQQRLQGMQPLPPATTSTVPAAATSTVPTPSGTPVALPPVNTLPVSQLPVDGDVTKPLPSPDGKSLFIYRKVGEDTVGGEQTDKVTHTFEIRSIDGQVSRTILQVNELVAKNQDSPGTNTWVPIGWNAEGTKVYVTVTPILGGLGGNFPDADAGARSLIEIDSQTGQQKSILNLGALWNIQNGIYLNTIQLQRNVFTYSTLQYNEEINQTTLYLSDLAQKNRQTVMTLRTGGIAHVEFSQDNSKLFIRTYDGGLVDDNYVYKNWEYGIATRVLREVKAQR